MRGTAVKVASGEVAAGEAVRVAAADLEALLGPARVEHDTVLRVALPGVATGLAWTPVGGDILFIEAMRVAGSGKLILTGQLGEVMRESAQAALTLVKSRAASLSVPAGAFDHVDVHLHVPAGAIPKDGPSAGVAMFVCAGLAVCRPCGAAGRRHDRRDQPARPGVISPPTCRNG